MLSEVKNEYDVIVIGSGIGGSSCAALLAASGLNTIVIEKNDRLGGACSSYYKNGYTIDVAVHIFAGCNHFKKVLKKTGHPNEINFYTELASKTAMQRKDTPPVKAFNSDNHGNDFIKANQEFLKILGASENDVQDILNILGTMMMIGKKDCYKYMDVPLSEFISQFTKSKIVHGLFAYFCGIMFTIPTSIASTGEYLYSMYQGNGSLAYPYGGAIAIPNGFCRIVEKEGGKVLINSRVKKILLNGNKVEGVELKDGTQIKSTIIVSNAGIKPTILNLLEDISILEKRYVKKVKNLIPSFSAITFKVALQKPMITEFDAVHLFHADLNSFKENSLTNIWKSLQEGKIPDDAAFMCPIPSNIDPSLAPKGKQLMIFGGIAPSKLPEGKSWKPWISRYWEMILDFYPDIEKNLDFLDVTTPQDIIIATGKSEAPVEGTALTVNQSGHNRISSVIPNVEGLYVAGDTAGTNIHGVGTQIALYSGVNVFNLIQDKYSHLIKKPIRIKVK